MRSGVAFCRSMNRDMPKSKRCHPTNCWGRWSRLCPLLNSDRQALWRSQEWLTKPILCVVPQRGRCARVGCFFQPEAIPSAAWRLLRRVSIWRKSTPTRPSSQRHSILEKAISGPTSNLTILPSPAILSGLS
jgi:hypothetical protein